MKSVGNIPGHFSCFIPTFCCEKVIAFSQTIFKTFQESSRTFVAKVMYLSNRLLDSIDQLRQAYFPTTVKRNGDELGVGSFSKIIQKNNKEDIRQFLQSVNLERRSEIANPLDAKEKMGGLSSFLNDLSGFDFIILNGEKIFDKNNPDLQAQFEATKKLAATPGYYHLTSLMHQGVTAKSWAFLNQELQTLARADMTLSSIERRSLAFQINLTDTQAHISIKFPLKITRIDPKSCCGYLAVKREITLSKADLIQDWKATPLNQIAPSLEVTDVYSRYADTVDGALINI